MSKKQTTSRRQVVREQRERRQRQQRRNMILGIGAVALFIAALLIVPSILEANRPVGEITEITPRERPFEDGLALGDPDAPVVIQVFEDFQCPACKGYTEQIETQVIDTYVASGQVRYEFYQYPFLDDRFGGGESDAAANASMCANEQDRFWDYHDLLYANWNGENQGAFSDQRLMAFAESLSMDMDAFEACFDENRYQDVIDEHLAEGNRLGVQGTPSVFVNGKIIKPGFVPGFEDIQAAVEAELAAAGN